MTRLVADRGCSMTGGVAAAAGRFMTARLSRSCTICRACRMSVPRLNCRTICDNPFTDRERITSSSGVPESTSSMGLVIRSSTSADDMPWPSVWISTLGGANSGNTSTAIWRKRDWPKNTRAAAPAMTRYRNLKLEATIQRIIGCLFLSLVRTSQPLVANLEFGAEQLQRSYCDDRRAGRWAARQHSQIAVEVFGLEWGTDVATLFTAGVYARAARRIVQNGGVGYDDATYAARPTRGHRPDGRGLDAEALRCVRSQRHAGHLSALDVVDGGRLLFLRGRRLRLLAARHQRHADSDQTQSSCWRNHWVTSLVSVPRPRSASRRAPNRRYSAGTT